MQVLNKHAAVRCSPSLWPVVHGQQSTITTVLKVGAQRLRALPSLRAFTQRSGTGRQPEMPTTTVSLCGQRSTRPSELTRGASYYLQPDMAQKLPSPPLYGHGSCTMYNNLQLVVQQEQPYALLVPCTLPCASAQPPCLSHTAAPQPRSHASCSASICSCWQACKWHRIAAAMGGGTAVLPVQVTVTELLQLHRHAAGTVWG